MMIRRIGTNILISGMNLKQAKQLFQNLKVIFSNATLLESDV